MIKKLHALLIGICLTAVGCSQQHSPEESIQVFYESLSHQDYPELLSLFNLENNLQDQRSESELYEILAIIFKDLAFNIQEKGGIHKIEYHSIEYNSDKSRATVRYTLNFKDESYTFDTLFLIKDHTGFWQLTLE
ncbi:hypothetical protein MMG00_08300 [Ignatzschineria rhizosphaerae]|uniref:DUF4878 domain-containing protein n=1 Tax=Ignatzschineria rhizosphaerae TaxID=2923279 RepID=A0ABY3X040_9GAMM|nr:hypothetical protein [Ignatzschineria rhizosphaerae]UNM95230.1 hypothetical protein MMG00_08300 [Ignatzschineria rhizosphaerae]